MGGAWWINKTNAGCHVFIIIAFCINHRFIVCRMPKLLTVIYCLLVMCTSKAISDSYCLQIKVAFSLLEISEMEWEEQIQS